MHCKDAQYEAGIEFVPGASEACMHCVAGAPEITCTRKQQKYTCFCAISRVYAFFFFWFVLSHFRSQALFPAKHRSSVPYLLQS